MNSITGISVTNLFGYIDYEINEKNLADGTFYFIYAQNGFGKTTFLNLVYNLLCFEFGAGSKTFLLNTKFSRLQIDLSCGTKISAFRLSKEDGPYTIIIENKNGIEEEYKVNRNSDEPVVKLHDIDNVKQLFQTLKETSPSLIYLPADRFTRSVSHKKNSLRTTFRDRELAITSELKRKLTSAALTEIQQKIFANQIGNFENWIRNEIFDHQRAAIRGSDQVYLRLIKELSSEQSKNAISSPKDAVKFIKKIERDSEQSHAYGISIGTKLDELTKIINNIDEGSWNKIEDLTNSFLNSQKKQLQEINKLVKKLNNVINDINQYLEHKYVSFDLSAGFTIHNSITETIVDPMHLSSGEKQLLTLLTLATSASPNTLIIIDEPEISLNSIWQNRIGSSLKRFSQGNELQYLIASHSIEIVSNYTDFVASPKVSKRT